MYRKNTSRLTSCLALMASLFGLSLGFSASPTAVAQPANASRGPITIDLTAFKVVRDDKGKEQFSEAKSAKPGDVLEYRAVYANVSKKEVKNLQANLPIPESTEIILDSVNPKPALASTDGRKFAAPPLKRTVKSSDGTTATLAVPLGAYRMLRWSVGTLAAGDSVTLRARVRLYGAVPAVN